MKLLHIGLCANGHPYSGLQEALSDKFDYAEISTNQPHDELNKQAVSLSKIFNPDIVFIQIQSPNIILPETISKIRETGAFVMNWTGDVRSEIHSWFKEFGADVTLFSNMPDVIKMTEEGYNADYLQIGIDPKIFTPEGSIVKCQDIIFLGNNYGAEAFPLSQYRIDIVEALKNRYGSRFGVYGNGWGDYTDGEVNSSQITEAAIYRGCKIAINCSHFNYSRYFSDRMIRLMGSGAFCLSHNYNDIDKDWDIGEDLVTFDNIDGLIQKCDYYLKNNTERNIIAATGCNKTHKTFRYSNMVDNISKIYKKWKK